MKRIWITWERHRRTSELALAIPGVILYELTLDQSPRIVRYPYLLLRTAMTLFKEFPRLLLVQNPSLILALFAGILRKIIGFRFVVDAHNEGIAPFSPSHNWLLPIYATIQKCADLTIVTNSFLADVVSNHGGTPFVLEDMIPRISASDTVTLSGKRNCVYICTFEKDEPYMEVIKAAELINRNTYIYITGNHYKISPNFVYAAPPNVIFTGFLPDQDYINLLHSCDVVIDLTHMKNCLVCGAYESVALGTPVILSDTETQRTYFSKGVVYTRNSAREIATAIKIALDTKETLTREIALLKNEIEGKWNERFSEFVFLLQKLEGRRAR